MSSCRPRRVLAMLADRTHAVARPRRAAALAVATLAAAGLAAVTDVASPSPLFSAAYLSFNTGRSPFSVAAGDLNGDGHADLVVVNQSSTSVSVLLGDGEGTILTRRDFPAGNSPVAVAVADPNADGKLDGVVGNLGGNTVSVMLGLGD